MQYVWYAFPRDNAAIVFWRFPLGELVLLPAEELRDKGRSLTGIDFSRLLLWLSLSPRKFHRWKVAAGSLS